LVIDQLRCAFTDQNVAIAFFYFDYLDQDHQSPENVVASILKQLVSYKSMLPRPVAELHERLEKQRGHPKLQDLVTTLLLTCQEFREVFIIIDALDECDAKRHRQPFLKVLKDLKNASVKVFVTSRPYPDDIKRHLDASPEIIIEASDSDIRKYLAHKIDQDGRPDLIDESLKDKIVTDVVNGAQGMLVDLFRTNVISDHAV
jgi:hypothetical protein